MEAIKDLITCGVCLEIYTDPHVLQCLHTLCAACIKAICKHGELICPECRAISKVKSVKKNFHTQSLIDVYYENARPVSARARMKSKKGCEICAKGAIAKKCKDCDKLVCADCSANHSSIPSCSDHVMLDMDVISKQSRTKLDELKTRLTSLGETCKGKEREVKRYTEKLRTLRKNAESKINESEQEAIQKIKDAHDEIRSTMKSDLLFEEKKLGKFGQHIKFASGEIDDMMELISEITSAKIDPARLVYATTELCDGVESSLTDLDVSSIQIGDVDVTVAPATIAFEKAATCKVDHLRETCNTKDANVSFKALVKYSLNKAFDVKVEEDTIQGLCVVSKSVVVLQHDSILHFSLDGKFINKITHELLRNAHRFTKLHTNHLAIACGSDDSNEAKIVEHSLEGEFIGVIATGEFCDLTAVGKKVYAVSLKKQRIEIFTPTSLNKWVDTGSIALETPCDVFDTIIATSVSVLVCSNKEGRIQEFTHSGEPMNDVLYPGDKPDRIDVTEETQLRIGPSDNAGALPVINTKTGCTKILNSHRKWLDWKLPTGKHDTVSAIAVDEKGRVWLVCGSRLFCFECAH